MCQPCPVTEGSRKAILAALVANFGIAVAKFVGYVLTSSASLLAEAGHSLADSGNQALLLLGGRRAAKPADDEHPFGYGRERYFWAFVVAMVLFSMGGLFALYEGIQKLRHPHETENLPIAIGILLFAIALETYSLRTAVKEAQHARPKGMSWWRYIRTAKEPELPVVLLEDTGAEIGLFLALAGVLTAHYTGDPRWDAVGSIAIGVLLVVIAILLAVETKGLLIGEAADPGVRSRLVAAIEGAPKVERLIHMRTEHLGPAQLVVGAKIEMDPTLTFDEVAGAIDEIETRMREATTSAMIVYLEPAIHQVDAQRSMPGTAAPDGDAMTGG
jgi:cation diffusion facilitator family transporter